METNIGVDAITMTWISNQQLIDNIEKKRKNSEKLYFKVKRTNKENEYSVVIILPCYLYDTNIKGFDVCDNIEVAKKRIKQTMQKNLQTNDLNKFVVKSIECNANTRISAKANIDMVIGLLARTLLSSDKKLIEYVIGKRLKETDLIKNPIITGFRTDRDSSARYYIKVYNKSRQMETDENVFRLELQYTSRGVKQIFGTQEDVTLEDVMQLNNIKRITNRYITDVEAFIEPCINEYLIGSKKVILKDLKRGYKAYRTFLLHHDIVQYDYNIFREALEMYYSFEGKRVQTARQRASKIKKQAEFEGIEIYEGAIKELKKFLENIRLQESIVKKG